MINRKNIWAAGRLQSWVDAEDNGIDICKLLSDLRKGKTYEELFGVEVANRTKQILKENRLGKTYEELFGIEEAIRIKTQMSKDRLGVKMPESHRQNMRLSKIEYWANLDIDKKNEILDALHQGRHQWFCNISDNELKEWQNNISTGVKKWWDTAPKEIIKERNRKIGEKHKGKTVSKETRKKISEKHPDVSGNKNPMYGKKHKESTRKIQSEKAKGREPYNKGKPTSIFKFFKDGEFIDEIKGQKNAKEFCLKHNIPFSTLCKKSDHWKNWKCKRNKKQ